MSKVLLSAGLTSWLFALGLSNSALTQSNSPSAAPVESPAVRAARHLPLRICQVPGLKEDVLCGTYEVYENRSKKTGRKIALNLVVLPALGLTPAPDPLFPLAGGPGQAATDGAANDAQRFAEIRRERDIVLVDQRGTGKSNRLTCQFDDFSDLLTTFMVGEIKDDVIKKCRAELELKADLRQYTTTNAVDDLDEVRAWLGYEHINLYGGSYGTRPAQIYLKRYPQRVRTVTLRAVTAIVSKNPLYAPRDSQNALDRLFEDCAKGPSCQQAFPNLRQDFQTLLARLAATPVRVPSASARSGETLITADLFAGVVRRLLYDASTQRQLPLIIRNALANDFSTLGPIASQISSLANGLSLGMMLSVICAEDVSFIREGEIAREAQGKLGGEHFVRVVVNACRHWPHDKLPADYAKPLKGKAPVLLLSGTLDPVTPPVWADAIAKNLPNSLHVAMEGIAHGPFPACAQGLMAKFIAAGTVTGLDTSCVKELRRPPFIMPAAKQ